jgi:hypothetical protein
VARPGRVAPWASDHSITHRKERADLISVHALVQRGSSAWDVPPNYLPTRDHTFSVGYQIPLGEGWVGRTRPKTDHVKLLEPAQRSMAGAGAVDPALSDALAHVRHAAEWQARCVAPFLDQKGDTREEVIDRLLERIRFFQEHVAVTDALYPAGHTCPEEIRVYHEELDRAFSVAAGGTPGGRPARAARPDVGSPARRATSCSTRCSFPTTATWAASGNPTPRGVSRPRRGRRSCSG